MIPAIRMPDVGHTRLLESLNFLGNVFSIPHVAPARSAVAAAVATVEQVMKMRDPKIESLPTVFGVLVARMHFPSIEGPSGTLTPFDLGAVPIAVVRAFHVTAPAGAIRGEHAHIMGSQLLLRLSGEIEVELSYKGAAATVLLHAENNALLISSPVWSRQLYRGPGASLLVFCDTPYDPSTYVHDRLLPATS
jgi:hypothetical protein